MVKKRIHRISVYLLGPERKQILLHKAPQGPFCGAYVPFSASLNERETPTETVERLVKQLNLNYEIIGHSISMPVLLDERSMKIYPPLHVQVTAIDPQLDFVDYVYLAQAKSAPKFDPKSNLCWFSPKNLKSAPGHVKHLVHYILSLMNH